MLQLVKVPQFRMWLDIFLLFGNNYQIYVVFFGLQITLNITQTPYRLYRDLKVI